MLHISHPNTLTPQIKEVWMNLNVIMLHHDCPCQVVREAQWPVWLTLVTHRRFPACNTDCSHSTLPFIRFSHMLVGFVYFLRRHSVVYGTVCVCVFVSSLGC